MADEQDRVQSPVTPDKRDLQKQKEAAVDAAFRNPFNTIIPVDLEEEMKKSFIDYAMSVISDRALLMFATD
jgi:DNA gyrase subunit A